MAHGLTDFASWSKAMLAEEGSESLRPFLPMIFDNSKRMLDRTENIFEAAEQRRHKIATHRPDNSTQREHATRVNHLDAGEIVSQIGEVFTHLSDQHQLVKSRSSLPCSWFSARECFMIAYEEEYTRLPETLQNSYHGVYGELAFFVEDGLYVEFNASLNVAAKCRSERLRKLGLSEDEAFCRSFIASHTVKIQDREAIWEHLGCEETCPRNDLLLLAETLCYCGGLYRALWDEWAAFANLVAYRNKRNDRT